MKDVKSNGNFKSRGKTGKPRRNFKKEKTDEVDVKRQSFNDPSWYIANDQVVTDVASISFNNPVGVPISLGTAPGSQYGSKIVGAIPGVLSIYTTPACGVSPNTNPGASALNVAARNIYSWIRHVNSGHANYDPADLMIYLLAMDSLYSYYAWMVRIYSAARVRSSVNRYLGDFMLKAMGVSPDDITAHLADFRNFINNFVYKVSTLNVPNIMSIYTRHVWMYSNVFKDEDVDKAQLYLYNPGFLWHFTLNADGAGALEPYPVCLNVNNSGVIGYEENMTFMDIQLKAITLIDSLMTQEDIGIISGDILKACNGNLNELWRINTIGEDYYTLPVFSEEVLAQIHNTDFAGSEPLNPNGTLGIGTLGLGQDPNVSRGNILFMPRFMGKRCLDYDKLLDSWHDHPDANEVIVSTRNALSAIDGQIIACGSEICMFAALYDYDANMNFRRSTCYWNDTWPTTGNIYQLTKFNEPPREIIFNSSSGEYIGVFGELSNYTILTHNEIQKLHDAAIMAMLAVHKIGPITR